MMLQTVSGLGALLLAALTTQAQGRALGDKPTTYNLWSREPKPRPSGSTPYQGMDLPFRRNGTWQDVGVWQFREDVIAQQPFTFTLGPGRTNQTYTLTDVATGKKLAYTEDNLDLDVNYAIIAAFILTDQGNNRYQVVDDWTIEKDKYNRTILGLGPLDAKENNGFWVGNDGIWAAQNCAWSGKFCDGTYFFQCGACYGIPSVIEVMEAK
ncbi:hypothetical protein BU24DRAFT_495536 [Aaosphaeria arxii CBS 175.79]|uniref:Carbohydrate-binding module family 1 protein n=1 Tax=Aaosphaeria arxii CBS 175.79 TaxID=1450172 RepID=A0A6A5XE73_9PLEO|nr:uncharacterized protein BU24DRAFT_495536 [Aaosphaeria arxii CBS 175.79]KAF2011338.1 hypothetical protein BU24DRAFT_495536 [Aaosphaeria arxii CBS 175.79]